MKIPKNVWKTLLLLAGLILICTFLSRYFSSSETLSDYASSHPELQIKEVETTTEPISTEEVFSEPEMSSEENSETEEDTVPFEDEYADSEERSIEADGFYYEPIPRYIQNEITGVSYPEDASVSMNDLRYLNIQYYDFDNNVQNGELICNAAIAQDLIEIFHDLFKAEYQIEKVKLIDCYQGDDDLSVLDNNTSCFNYRVVSGTNHLSNHAYGLAIDINPFYNPYITYSNGEEKISPIGSEPYADRTVAFPYKIDETDLCYKLFTAHGFTWGGNWNSCKDYQHFEKKIN